jgi:hypothetical protein
VPKDDELDAASDIELDIPLDDSGIALLLDSGAAEDSGTAEDSSTADERTSPVSAPAEDASSPQAEKTAHATEVAKPNFRRFFFIFSYQ